MAQVVFPAMDRTLAPTESALAFLMFLPFLLLLFPGFSQLFDGLGFWMAMFVCGSIIWLTVLIRAARGTTTHVPHKRAIAEKDYPVAIKQVMNVDAATEEEGIKVFRGQLIELASAAHERLQAAFKDETVILLPVRDDKGHCSSDKGGCVAVMLVAKPNRPKSAGPAQTMLDWLLLAVSLGASALVGFR
jgi:hypothetical protein